MIRPETIFITPLVISGVLAFIAARQFANANAEIMRSLNMPEELVKLAGSPLLIRIGGSIALLGAVVWIIGECQNWW